MRKIFTVTLIALGYSTSLFAGTPASCTPNAATSFQDYLNRAYTLSNDAMGNNILTSQCTKLTQQQSTNLSNTCGPLTNPINGLGLSPVDQLLYGLMPTDTRGISTHLEMTFPFPAPGKPGDIMKADPVDIYRIGHDGGYENIGTIQPPIETATSGDMEQVVPIVHSAATFNQAGDYFVLAYRTNYESSANVTAGTGEVDYQAPQIVIGEISKADLAIASGGNISTSWTDVDDSSDPVCAAVVNQFRNQTNAFSACVVSDFIANNNHNQAVDNCFASSGIMNKGIHDFAVSPANNHFYAYDSQTYNDKDVLIDVDPTSQMASCTEFDDVGNLTGRLTSLMFSQQNKLVALFADETAGIWIDVNSGTSYGDIKLITTPPVVAYPNGDGASLPFSVVKNQRGVIITDLIFKNGFEDFIFADGFEGSGPPPPFCPAF